MHNGKVKIAASIILIVTFFSFYPSLKNEFTNWDDNKYVTENKVIQSLSPNNLRQIFTSFVFGNYHPLTVLSFSVEFQFCKPSPFIYHLTNVILHLFNCLLVFWLFFILAGNIRVPFITAILFGIHPLHVESVAWISGRKDLLYAFFFLAAIISYVFYLQKNCRRYYYFSIFLFVLSLLSKAMAISFPLILFIFDYLLHRKKDKAMFADKIPFLILSFIFGIIAVLGQHVIGAIRQESAFDLLHKAMIASYAIVFYLGKLFLPVGLSCLYPYNPIANSAISASSALVILSVAVAVVLSAKFTRKIAFGASFFLIAISPALQFVPITSAIVADRYTYVPSIGLFYIAGLLFSWAYDSSPRHRLFRAILTAILTATLLIFSFLTYQRCGVWRKSIILWEDSVRNNSGAALAYYNLGDAYLDADEKEKAIAVYRKAIAVNPNYADAYNNLCYACRLIGKYQEAIEYCRKAIQINPGMSRSYYNLGEIYENTGQKEEAIKAYSKALEINDRDLESCNNLAAIYADNGDIERGIKLWNKAVQISPDFATAHFNLAVFYYRQGKYALAIKHCDKVIGLGNRIDARFLKLLEPYRK